MTEALIESNYDFGNTIIQGDYTPYQKGSTITAYHGTTSSGIEIFDPSKSSIDSLHGKGIFFTTDPIEALGYALGRPSGERHSGDGFVYECKITFDKIMDVGIYTEFDPNIFKEVFGLELQEGERISRNDIWDMANSAQKQGIGVNGDNVHTMFSNAGYTAAIKYACPTDFSARTYHDRIKMMNKKGIKIVKSMTSKEARANFKEELAKQKEYLGY